MPSVVHVQWSGGVGGIARLVADLAHAQSNLGSRVGLAFGTAEGPFAEPMASSELDGLLDLGFSSGYDVRPWRLARAKALLKEWDVVHLHGFNVPLALAALGSGRPIVYTEHGSLPAGWRRVLAATIKGRLLAILLKRRATAVAANSRHTARLTSRICRLRPEQVSVIYNGLFAARHNPKRATAAGTELVAVFVGRLVHFKRVDRILEAAAKMAPGARVRLRIVGEGPLEAEMQVRARELSLGGVVEFLGIRDDVPHVLAEADVLLQPSQGEPFGLAIVEGCAQGLLPIVFADGGGALEVLPPDGLVVSSPDELARNLVDLVGSPALSPEARQARSSWAAERFSIDRTARAYEQMYREVAGSQHAREGDRQSLLFLAPGDVGKGRVEPISWMRTCLAFAERGLDVSLLTLRVRRPDAVSTKSAWKHFGIRPAFRIRVIPTRLRSDSSVSAFRLFGLAGAAAWAAAILLRQALRPRRAIIYARAPFLLAPFGMTRFLPAARRPQLVLETHTLPAGMAARVARRVDLLVVTSDKLRRDALAQLGLMDEQVLHAPLGPYNDTNVHDRGEARAALGLTPDAVIGCYSGKMIEEQTEFLLRVAGELRDRVPRFRLLLVGGNPKIDAWTRRRADELGVAELVIAPGFVEPPLVELYQAAADVLVFHMSESLAHFAYCTPAKGFEYQAAGRPIVATDIPLFGEVFGVDGDRAIRVRERTPAALARGIEAALSLAEGGSAMSKRAADWVSGRTWQSRVDAVLTALDNE